MEYCERDDIIVEIDAEDMLIGKQVFQLINSVYQRGSYYKGTKY